MGQLKRLMSIDLSGNRLSGQIPDEIGDCSALKRLNLSFNELYGQIPFSISKLKQLEVLILNNNQLTGPIPSPLPNLKFLNVALNKLSGSIPRLIYSNKVLQYLELQDNNLGGSLSSDMCDLSGLWYFNVQNNSLTGSIPQSIGNCTALRYLSLQANHFSGQIPSAIGLMQALAILDLSYNKLNGTIPSILGNLTNTTKLFLHGNELTGSIPSELGNMTKLLHLILNDNKLSGHIPEELGKLTHLIHLNVANNQIDGPIPANLSSCTNLIRLNVHGNKLNGTIPTAFDQKLGSMEYLNLSSNDLKGQIPIELSRIGNLDTLDLSNNMLSGSIPSSLGHFDHLLKLNLSDNEINGYLPPELGQLKSIMEIDLSSNHLSGPIPPGLGQLQNLFVLKLENNNLSGDIRPLASCIGLNVLNVSYNNLSGSIPTGNNFSRFSLDSFLGNPDMCGITSPCHLSHPRDRTTISIAAILGIVLGALVILVLMLLAACWLQNPAPSIDTAVNFSSSKLVILDMNWAHSAKDIVRMTENLSASEIIGYGGSCTVYKCLLLNKFVAVKEVHHNPRFLKSFQTEYKIAGYIKHRNLLSLRGYYFSPSRYLLFYEYMENGSLSELLHDPTKKKRLDWNTRIRIALGSAQGLAYLHHDCGPQIIHRDVKSANIVVDKDFEAHVIDYGLAKILDTPQILTSTTTHPFASQTLTSWGAKGTRGYIDPHYMRFGHLTDKSDVYSYGIVLLELLTRRKALLHDGLSLHELIVEKAANDAVMEIVDPEITASCSDVGAVKKGFQLALLCAKQNPAERPGMKDVARILETLIPTVEPEHGISPYSSFEIQNETRGDSPPSQ